MRRSNAALIVHASYLDSLLGLAPKDCGTLVQSLIRIMDGEEVPERSGTVGTLLGVMAPSVVSFKHRFEAKGERRNRRGR